MLRLRSTEDSSVSTSDKANLVHNPRSQIYERWIDKRKAHEERSQRRNKRVPLSFIALIADTYHSSVLRRTEFVCNCSMSIDGQWRRISVRSSHKSIEPLLYDTRASYRKIECFLQWDTRTTLFDNYESQT